MTGPLSVYVEYPDSLQRITARDSNFVFGTVGTGDATLIIDGEFVEVEPNGAFLAWLPVPSASRGPGLESSADVELEEHVAVVGDLEVDLVELLVDAGQQLGHRGLVRTQEELTQGGQRLEDIFARATTADEAAALQGEAG